MRWLLRSGQAACAWTASSDGCQDMTLSSARHTAVGWAMFEKARPWFRCEANAASSFATSKQLDSCRWQCLQPAMPGRAGPRSSFADTTDAAGAQTRCFAVSSCAVCALLTMAQGYVCWTLIAVGRQVRRGYCFWGRLSVVTCPGWAMTGRQARTHCQLDTLPTARPCIA